MLVPYTKYVPAHSDDRIDESYRQAHEERQRRLGGRGVVATGEVRSSEQSQRGFTDDGRNDGCRKLG